MKPMITFSIAESIVAHLGGALKGHYAAQSYKKIDELTNAVAGQSGGIVLFHVNSSLNPLQDIHALLLVDADLKVFVLSDVPSFQEGEALLRIGIKGYGNARLHPAALLQALEAIEAGNHWYYPDFMQHLVLAVVHNAGETDETLLGALSERERETAMMVSDGLHNKEIAQKMGITERTVKAHLGAIFAKLGVKDRVGLVLKLRGK